MSTELSQDIAFGRESILHYNKNNLQAYHILTFPKKSYRLFQNSDKASINLHSFPLLYKTLIKAHVIYIKLYAIEILEKTRRKVYLLRYDKLIVFYLSRIVKGIIH